VAGPPGPPLSVHILSYCTLFSSQWFKEFADTGFSEEVLVPV